MNVNLLSSVPETKEDYIVLLNRLARALWWTAPSINPDCGKVEPPAGWRRDGQKAYANGVDWNPGSGKGYYRWDSTTSLWVLMG